MAVTRKQITHMDLYFIFGDENPIIQKYIMLNFNGSTWQINSLGKNNLFYYGTFTNDTDTLEFQIETAETLTLDQVYQKILELPEYSSGTLISS